jgi:hypothetical protein
LTVCELFLKLLYGFGVSCKALNNHEIVDRTSRGVGYKCKWWKVLTRNGRFTRQNVSWPRYPNSLQRIGSSTRA